MNFFGQEILVLVVFLPLAGALLLSFVPGEEKNIHRALALVFSGFTFIAGLALPMRFDRGVAGFQDSLTVNTPWIESIGVRFHMSVDGISLWLVMLTVFIVPFVILGSFSSVKERTKEFMIALLFLETAMLGSFVALDLVLFYVFFESMLIPMYLLIGVFGGPGRIYSAFKLFLYTMLGSVLMLLAILYLHHLHGTFDLRTLLGLETGIAAQKWLFGAFVIAFAVKAPMFPLHTWLPDAHVEAPTAGSVILAAILLKMGTYGLMRFAFPLFPEAAVIYAPVIAGFAVAGIVYGALMALAQTDMKKLVAYSSVSHMGFVVLGICALTPIAATGAVYQMLSHGLATGALFLLVGIIYERRHTRQILDFGGLAKVMPAYASVFMLVSLASIGLPGTSGFIGEFLIITGTFTAASPWAAGMAAIAATGVILGAVYMLLMYRRVFFGPLMNEENRKIPDLRFREWAVLLPFCLLIVILGVFPAPFLSVISPTADVYAGRVLSSAAPETHPVFNVALASQEVRRWASVRKPVAPILVGPSRNSVREQNPELDRIRLLAWEWNWPEDRERLMAEAEKSFEGRIDIDLSTVAFPSPPSYRRWRRIDKKPTEPGYVLDLRSTAKEGGK